MLFRSLNMLIDETKNVLQYSSRRDAELFTNRKRIALIRTVKCKSTVDGFTRIQRMKCVGFL